MEPLRQSQENGLPSAMGASVRASPVIAVVGPTGSGKTALAVALAQRFGGEIVNTDSLQVYRHLDIGTAKPTPEERAQAVHHLIDVVDLDQPFSAADYVAQATPVLTRLGGAGRLAILCGGTGLYFKALVEGLAEVPAVPASIRQDVADRAQRFGTPTLHAELAKLDPDRAAKLHPNDTARVTRALEVALATGQPLSSYHAQPATPPPLNLLHVGLRWERAALYAHLNRRVDAMLAQGWIEEVQAVLARGFPPDAKPLRAIGYLEIVEYVQGRRSRDSLAPDIQQRTRHYAKRQLTWFRHQTSVDWFEPGDLDGAARRVQQFLAQRQAP